MEKQLREITQPPRANRLTRVVSGWNKFPEEVIVVGSMCAFKGRIHDVWLAVFGEESVNFEVE